MPHPYISVIVSALLSQRLVFILSETVLDINSTKLVTYWFSDVFSSSVAAEPVIMHLVFPCLCVDCAAQLLNFTIFTLLLQFLKIILNVKFVFKRDYDLSYLMSS